jgi:hypothetical protein
VASPPQGGSCEREIARTPLPAGASGHSFRALDATPARETLMIVIMFNAVVPAGCVSDLARFRH